MKMFLFVTAALVALAAPVHAQPRDGVWAVDSGQNCKVPPKVYTLHIEIEPAREKYLFDNYLYHFENVATGSYDVERRVGGYSEVETTTERSVRANGRQGNPIGTSWIYEDVTSDMIKVYRNGKFSYFIVRCY